MFSPLLDCDFCIYDKVRGTTYKDTTEGFNLVYREELQMDISLMPCFYHSANLVLESITQENYISLDGVSTKRYFIFGFRDIGAIDISSIYYSIKTNSQMLMNEKEFYQSIRYNINDSFRLTAIASTDISIADISVQIDTIEYQSQGSTQDYLFCCNDTAIVASKKEQETIAKIIKARTLHTKEYRKLFKATPALEIEEISFLNKIPYDKPFVKSIWNLYDEGKGIERDVEHFIDAISRLKEYDDIDISSPESDDVVFLPIEGTFNKRYACRMFLLRNHIIANRIISRFGLIQYQVPVKTTNIDLILLIIGTHCRASAFSNNSDEIGSSMCDRNFQNVATVQPVIRTLLRIRKLEEANSILPIEKTPIYKDFSAAYDKFVVWEKSVYEKAYQQYKRYTNSMLLWKSEYCLYELVKLFYPDSIYQYRDSFLEMQSLDIYIPSIHTAIEYQGKQHYEPLAYFGGTSNFEEHQRRDAEKRVRCNQAGVELIEWPYIAKVTFPNVLDFLRKKIECFTFSEDTIIQSLKEGYPLPVALLPYLQSPVPKERPQTHEIRMYSLDGIFIKAFSSYDIAATETGISKVRIQKVCTGHGITGGDYLWKRVTINTPKDNIAPYQPVEQTNEACSVLQITTWGEVVSEFPSIASASKATGINNKSIRDVLKGRQKTAGNYIWKYNTLEKNRD